MRKCPYCDFNSYQMTGAAPEDAYVDALLRDLEAERELIAERPLHSIFLGGGTPSLFSGAAVHRLLDGIRSRAELRRDVEITLEANPGAIEAARFDAFREAGVNRLSIGVQSLRDAQLQGLGRVHSAADARAAAADARRAGFDDINLDLMYGLPRDDVSGALEDLDGVLELAPTHLSWYQLTLEPSTAFHRRPPPLPSDDTILTIETRGRALLEQCGFRRYEISAYATAGRECEHNLNYWQFGDYVGIGAGAHGKVTLLADGAIERRAKARNPRTYMAQAGNPAAVVSERIDVAQQVMLEFLMNALRLPDGISIARLEARTGQSVRAIEPALGEAERRGWLSEQDGVLKPTPAGLTFLNALLELF